MRTRSKILATLSILAGAGLLCLTMLFFMLSTAALQVAGRRDRESNLPSVGPTPQAAPTPTPRQKLFKFPTPAPTLTPPEIKQTAFEWLWPKELSTQDEGTVSFSAVTIAEGDLPPLEASPHEGAGAEALNLGLPHTPLASAFGPGYTAPPRLRWTRHHSRKRPRARLRRCSTKETPDGSGSSRRKTKAPRS